MGSNPLSYIEISQKNLIHNIKQFRNYIKKNIRIAVAIKGNAYGHGLSVVAKIIEPYIDYFQVDSIEELDILRKLSKKETFILGYVEKNDLSRAVLWKSIISIFSVQQLKMLNTVAKKLKIVQKILLPVDAYLGREGFLPEDLPKILLEINNCKNIKLLGMYAHFANIEDTADFSHAKKQIKEYEKMLLIAKNLGYRNLQTHISATSGILVYEKKNGFHPVVRLGIGAYGLWPSAHLRFLYENANFNLRPVLTWKTKIAQIKNLSKGSTIGYGLTYKTKKKMQIAVIPQGYADGFDRGFSNNGAVLVRGTRCKILGRVMMNMIVVDISHLKNVKAEEEVVILGRQKNEEITAEEMAKRIDTLNYEITTRISPLLPRIVV